MLPPPRLTPLCRRPSPHHLVAHPQARAPSQIKKGCEQPRLALAHRAAPRPRPQPHTTAGAFTNQIQKGFEEPRLLIVTDPRTDHQSIKEAAYMNIPVIAFCDTDSDLNVSARVLWAYDTSGLCARARAPGL